jgi:DNA repair exonuclease SbcCD ATPase subunit
MILEVFNFRCYRGAHRFEFDDHGLTLISGASGAGKSSLMMAMFFAITGNAPPKVIADGCDTCRVTLVWDPSLTITRSKRPNRVYVDIMSDSEDKRHYEDDLAQSYIHRIFGRHFDVTSYIQQQYQRTFVYASPSDKLEMLEKLCFDATSDDLHPEHLKKQCAILQRETQNQHTERKGRLATLESMYPTPLTPPETLPVFSAEHLTRLQSKREILREQLFLVDQKMHYEECYLRTCSELSELSLPENLTEQQLQDHIHASKRLEQLQKDFDKHVWAKHSKEECDLMITDYLRDIASLKEYKEASDSVTRLSSYVKELRSIEEEKDRIAQLHEGEYECPECKTALMLMNDELVRLRRSKRLNTFLPLSEKKTRIQALDRQAEVLRSKTQSIGHYEERMKTLEEQIDPQEDISSLESDLSWLQAYVAEQTQKETQNNVYIRQQAQLQKQLIPDLESTTAQVLLDQFQRKKNLESQRLAFKDRIDSFDRNLASKATLETEAKDIESEIRFLESLREQVEVCKFKEAEYLKFTQVQSIIRSTREELTRLERQMNALADLKQVISKSESEVIDAKIEDISTLVNVYAEHIFSDPITVELKTIKKSSTATEKVQIQLEVFYKNMQCDISLLSGGEQARLNLAFILAFAHVFQSPLLLLDECTSNLDQELTEVVLEHIQSVGITKVILIAHQVVEGNFGQILKLR